MLCFVSSMVNPDSCSTRTLINCIVLLNSVCSRLSVVAMDMHLWFRFQIRVVIVYFLSFFLPLFPLSLSLYRYVSPSIYRIIPLDPSRFLLNLSRSVSLSSLSLHLSRTFSLSSLSLSFSCSPSLTLSLSLCMCVSVYLCLSHWLSVSLCLSVCCKPPVLNWERPSRLWHCIR